VPISHPPGSALDSSTASTSFATSSSASALASMSVSAAATGPVRAPSKTHTEQAENDDHLHLVSLVDILWDVTKDFFHDTIPMVDSSSSTAKLEAERQPRMEARRDVMIPKRKPDDSDLNPHRQDVIQALVGFRGVHWMTFLHPDTRVPETIRVTVRMDITTSLTARIPSHLKPRHGLDPKRPIRLVSGPGFHSSLWWWYGTDTCQLNVVEFYLIQLRRHLLEALPLSFPAQVQPCIMQYLTPWSALDIYGSYRPGLAHLNYELIRKSSPKPLVNLRRREVREGTGHRFDNVSDAPCEVHLSRATLEPRPDPLGPVDQLSINMPRSMVRLVVEPHSSVEVLYTGAAWHWWSPTDHGVLSQTVL
jgi:hypothetical protein